MSPEQIEGEMVDERTDIYSPGIMAYELVTGQRPYPEDDLFELMDLHVQDVPDPTENLPTLILVKSSAGLTVTSSQK